jgi:tetratricopeptide (TPR) repeat protein
MAGRLAEGEPEQSHKHAKAARRLASRVGIVREAAGIAAYHAGEWAVALAELRAARRLGAGDDSYLPVMADCERGLGRPERALDLIKSPEAEKLDPLGRVELRIVESGVRRDMGQFDAAVVTLQIPELRDRRLRPWSMRLFYAYADALAEAGRDDEAADWFARAAAADRDGETDAAERYAEIEGLHILDTEEEEDEGAEITDEAPTDEAPTAEVPDAEVPAAEDGVVDGAFEEGLGTDGGEDAEGVVEDEAPEAPAEPEMPAVATDITFKPAEPEVLEARDEDVPQAPAVFLEPKPADEPAGEAADGEERPPAGD